jgi:hypothetical protein
MTFTPSVRHRATLAASVLLAIANAVNPAHAARSAACDKIPVQPRSTQSVGRDMVVNGVSTSLAGMEFAGTPKDISNAFREFWIREDVPAKARLNATGLMLSALDDQCLYILNIPSQVEGDSVRGFMSVIRLGEEQVAHKIADSVIPLPEASNVLSDVESRDPGQTGRTWILDMPGDAELNARRYRNTLTTRGWVSIGRVPDYWVFNNQSGRDTAFAMQHGADSVDVSFSDRGGRTAAVINTIRNR